MKVQAKLQLINRAKTITYAEVVQFKYNLYNINDEANVVILEWIDIILISLIRRPKFDSCKSF